MKVERVRRLWGRGHGDSEIPPVLSSDPPHYSLCSWCSPRELRAPGWAQAWGWGSSSWREARSPPQTTSRTWNDHQHHQSWQVSGTGGAFFHILENKFFSTYIETSLFSSFSKHKLEFLGTFSVTGQMLNVLLCSESSLLSKFKYLAWNVTWCSLIFRIETAR